MSTENGDLEERLRRAVDGLPEGLRAHILRVEHESMWLAERHGVDPARASLSALGHDLVRHLKGPELLALASVYRLQPDEIEVASPILTHGPIAAQILTHDYGFEDPDIIAGIDCHTTARAGMTPVEQVLFVADKVEPNKLAREPALGDVRQAAHNSLDAAVLRYLDMNIEKSLQKGWLLHPRTLEARNDLLQRIGAAQERQSQNRDY
jgi:predicted HD superfamily hydrolase involved in NAD metabolism